MAVPGALRQPVIFPPPQPSPTLTEGDADNGQALDYGLVRTWAKMTVEPMEMRLEVKSNIILTF